MQGNDFQAIERKELALSLSVANEIQSGLAHWEPHAGQQRVGYQLFYNRIRSLFVQCGRKWGKTEFALYVLWRIAKQYSNSPCYFIAPLQVQAKEIVWADPRIQNFGPREWLKPGSQGINNTEMRLNLTNGSFIKIDGSDNYEKYRGPRFKVCVYEEYKDHRPEFRKAMRPNAAVLDGTELFIGSPPDRHCDYSVVAEDHRVTPSKYFYQAPTWENHHIDRNWLLEEKKGLYLRGEGDVWEREYAAKEVHGGAQKIFPMFGKNLVKNHDELMRSIERDRKKLEWVMWTDPAAASCFGGLFVAHNPYTKMLYILDEIYEQDPSKMTVKQMGSTIFKMRDDLYQRGEWRMGYDEAETWFCNEMIDNFPDEDSFEPSHKSANDKESALSLIKDIMLCDRMVISDRCVKFFWEMENYFKDSKGKIPKKYDHLIDCLRYILAALHYSLPEEREPIPDGGRRAISLTEEFPQFTGLI